MVVKKKLLFIFAWILLFWVVPASCSFAESKTVEVLPNIYTVVHGEGVDSNSTFIITRDGVIVIDTRTTPAEARKVMKEIRKRTQLPVVYTINTHYHGDHTFGNQVFLSGKTIIAHKNVHKLLKGNLGKEHLEKFKSFGIPGLDEVQITLPNLVYEKRMDLYLGGYHLQLIHLGPGHTDGDTFIYLEELKTAITGDLVFNKQIPYLADGFVEEWIRSLDDIENRDVEVVIPGHGDVGGKPIMIAMKHYLLNLRNLVQDQVNQGMGLNETIRAVRPKLQEKYQDWGHPERIDGNIRRAFLEFSLKKKL